MPPLRPFYADDAAIERACRHTIYAEAALAAAAAYRFIFFRSPADAFFVRLHFAFARFTS